MIPSHRNLSQAPWWQVLLWAILLALPILVLHWVTHLEAHRNGLVYTGFFQMDMPWYVALSRHYFHDGVHFFTANPLAADLEAARIYFFWPMWLFGAFQGLTNLNPAVAFTLFGFLAGIAVFYQLIRLLEQVYGLEKATDWLAVVIFAWGGGIFAVLGLARLAILGLGYEEVFAFDVYGGWWLLNFGRNIALPLEAVYHLVALVLLRLLYMGANRWALVPLLLISQASPWTGLQMLCFCIGWFVLEKMPFWKRSHVGFASIAGSLILLAVLLLYHLYILKQDGIHRAVHEQNALDRPLDIETMLPAYCLVSIFALVRIWRAGWRNLQFLQHRDIRLGLTLFGVSFLLANNEVFLAEPLQPLHFARGYIWGSLLFLGFPVLKEMLSSLASQFPRAKPAVLGFVLLFFVLDNLLWIGTYPYHTPDRSGMMKPEAYRIATWLSENLEPDQRFIWQDNFASLLVAAQSHTRPWSSHPLTTPHFSLREQEVDAATSDARLTAAMRRYDLVIVLGSQQAKNFFPQFAERFPGESPPQLLHHEGDTGIILIPSAH